MKKSAVSFNENILAFWEKVRRYLYGMSKYFKISSGRSAINSGL